MTEGAFIAGDWGTSRLRLYLCAADGAVLARRDGDGAAVPDCAGRFEAAVKGWDRDAPLPAILGGMVGSTIGWREVPYLACPAKPAAIGGAALRFVAHARAVAIVPGLQCVNALGVPDVMRGEEVQILGALRLRPHLAQGRHLLCMPGTHTKWVEMEDGAVMRFQTALSGELFQILRHHSVLVQGRGDADPQSTAFARGLAHARAHGSYGLLHLLFSTRSLVVTGGMAAGEAASYLSGLIVGTDVGAMLGHHVVPQVLLICSPALAALYVRALDAYGVDASAIDGDGAAVAGLVQLYTELLA